MIKEEKQVHLQKSSGTKELDRLVWFCKNQSGHFRIFLNGGKEP